ncbi:MAG TPA: PKD domain-containing protein [Bacteroidales bacterium]|nr:PKD domain-containing protein [Bacteroidales bacterium]HSA44315.1 PKD domain-containing protein [Bacteroidales bacterium]
MKKLTLLLLMMVGTFSLLSAQTMNFHIFGHVTDPMANMPLVNHDVTIASDPAASGGFTYNTTVQTNQAGKYFVHFPTPPNQILVFNISTTDCNGVIHTITDSSAGPSIIANFSICGNAPQNCQAKFLVHHVPGNPLAFHFQNISLGFPATYLWTFGDGDSSTAIDAAHVYAQAGTYQVCLTMVNNSGCTDTYCKQIVIASPPPPPPCHAKFNYHKFGLTVKFHAHALGGTPPYTFAWDFGDGDTSSLKKPTHVYDTAGIYTVTLIISSSDGCADTAVKTVHVTAPNPGPFNLHGAVFAGNSPVFPAKVLLIKKDPATQSLLHLDSTLVDTTGHFGFQQLPAGVYFLKAFPAPGTIFDSLFMPTYFPHHPGPSPMSAIHLPPLHNPYIIHLKHKTVNPPSPLQKSETAGTTDEDLPMLYPNPAGHQLNIRLNQETDQSIEIRMYNSLGQEVIRETREVAESSQEIILDVSHLNAGIFTLIIDKAQAGTSTHKILIDR